MAKTKLARYLFQRIQEADVEYTFGIPGDFVLPVYAAQENAGIKTVVMTHEPGVGYAADAYARLKGLGVALVTYGAGGLNMINPVGLAYAEESPLLVVSGGPETRFRNQKPLLHHCVKSFDTQLRVYAEVTESQAILNNEVTAASEIDRVIATTQSRSRPGYIEIPRDMVNQDIESIDPVLKREPDCPPALTEAAQEILSRLMEAQQPILFVGVEVRRFKVTEKVIALAEALNLPVVTSILGKASFPETHPNFIGNYFGQFGNPKVREYVESSDCIFALGTIFTEMETAGYTAKLPTKSLIQATAQETVVGHHSYSGVDLPLLVEELLGDIRSNLMRSKRFVVPQIPPEEPPASSLKGTLTVAGMIDELNHMLSERYSVVCDVGDCLYAGMSLKTDVFLAPGYYSSMGFGVPAGIGAQLADPSRRPIVLVGDGGFQMTGMEISTAVKLGLNPIIVLFDNTSYAMLRFIDKERDYYKLPRWDYTALASAVGARGMQATTRQEFHSALIAAQKSDELFLIDAVIAEDDISPTLKRLTDHFGTKVRASIS